MTNAKSLIQLAGILLALALFGVFGARYVGKMTENATLERIETVLPQFAGMPQQERSFVIELALTCNVLARPAVRAEVLDCLRSTATKTGPEASAKLDAMLKGR